ncbi:hypothetical protein [Mangrovimonas sp. DI 80]|uniref:hypothetical protein n=1 Tax=Mangrovimonas sp. DI 80 TaxID=1779330 RepID=UPI000978B6E6|nr:hypothetical protein [Mangrovimonas sp. DI 80]OMP32064.1 hypothetical protein BKM32_03135 [Mangrovimonas sp. DI 80]
MFQKAITIFFLSVFVAFIAAPTVVAVLDNDFDMTAFFSVNEEEEKSVEKIKDNEIKFFEFDKNELVFDVSKEKRITVLPVKHYSKKFFKIISPPPEHTIV